MALTTCLIAGLLLFVTAQHGDRANAVELGSGQAWFASSTSGTVSLIDGGTGSRVVRVAVATPGDDLRAVQASASALAVNRTTGAISRVEALNWGTTAQVSAGAPDDSRLDAIANAHSAWVISHDASVVQEYDPQSLVPQSAPLTTPSDITGTALATSGRLWLISAEGNLRSYRHGQELTNARIADAPEAAIVLANESPVVVNRAQRTAFVIDASSGQPKRSVCLDVPSNGTPMFATSSGRRPWVIAMSSFAATLLVSRTDTGRCQPILLGDSGNENRYGGPVEKDGLVYIPDYVAGRVIVVDPDNIPSRQIVRRVNVDLANSQFELVSYGDHLWFDQPDGDTSGVITDDFRAIAVSKNGDNPNGRVIRQDDDEADKRPLPLMSCATPLTPPVPNEPMTLTALSEDPTFVPNRYEWRLPGGTPSRAVQQQVTVSFPPGTPISASFTAFFGSRTRTVVCSFANTPPSTSTTQTTVVKPGITNPSTTEATVEPGSSTTTTTSPPRGGTTTTVAGTTTSSSVIDPRRPTSTTGSTINPLRGTTTTSSTVNPRRGTSTTGGTIKPRRGGTSTTRPRATTSTTGRTITTKPRPVTTTTTTTVVPPDLPPVPRFSVSVNPASTGRSVTVTDITAGSHSRSWSVEGQPKITSGNLTSKTIHVTWASPGTFRIGLTATNRSGSATTFRSVVVNPLPTVPPVHGELRDAAMDRIDRAGLTARVGDPINSNLPVGVIAGSTPPAGTRLDENSIVTIHPSNGIGLLNTLSGPGNGLKAPTDLAIDKFGRMFAIDRDLGLLQISNDGTVTMLQGGKCEWACHHRFSGLSVDGDGQLYIGDPESLVVWKVDPATGKGAVFAGNFKEGTGGDGGGPLAASLLTPMDIDIDAKGNVIITTANSHMFQLRIVDPKGTVINTLYSGSPGGLRLASTVSGDDVYVSSTEMHRVYRLRMNDNKPALESVVGTGSIDFNGDGHPADKTNVVWVSGLLFDKYGRLFLLDTGHERVRVLETDGNIYTAIGGGNDRGEGSPGPSAFLSFAFESAGLAFDSNGALCFTETKMASIRCLS